MPRLSANSKEPIILAPSNSAEAAGTVPVSIAVRYAAHMAIPTMPTNIGFSVRNHKIPTPNAQKITIDKPPNIESKGRSIVLSGSVAQGHVPSSKHSGSSALAKASWDATPITATDIMFRLNAM